MRRGTVKQMRTMRIQMNKDGSIKSHIDRKINHCVNDRMTMLKLFLLINVEKS